MKALIAKTAFLLTACIVLGCKNDVEMPTSTTSSNNNNLSLPDAPVKSERLALSGELTLNAGYSLCDGGSCSSGGSPASQPTTQQPTVQSTGNTTPAQSTPTGLPQGAIASGNGYWLNANETGAYAGLMRYYEKGSSGYEARDWYGGYGKMSESGNGSDFVQDPSKQNFTMMKGAYADNSISSISTDQQFVTKYDPTNKTWVGQMYNNDQPYNPDPKGKVAATNSSAVYNPQTGLWNYGWTIPAATNGGQPINFTTNTYDFYNASQTVGTQFQYQVGQGTPVMYQPTAQTLGFQYFIQALQNSGMQ